MIVSSHISVGNKFNSALVLGVKQVGPENVVLRSCKAVGAGTVVVQSWCCSRCVFGCCSNWMVTGRSRESREVIMSCTPGQSEVGNRHVYKCRYSIQMQLARSTRQPGKDSATARHAMQHASGSKSAWTPPRGYTSLYVGGAGRDERLMWRRCKVS